MQYKEILAKSKPPITLIRHTEDCFEKLNQVLLWKANLIERIASHYSISGGLLIKRLFLTVAFHDIGKASKAFQDKVRGLAYKQPESHALASLPFIYNIVKASPLSFLDESGYFPEALAIVSHHCRLHKHLFADYESKVEYAEDAYFHSFYEIVNLWARKVRIPYWENILFDPSLINSTPPAHLLEDKIFGPFREYESDKQEVSKFRDLYLLFKSVLHYADWLASSGNHEYRYAHNESVGSITDKMKNCGAAICRLVAFSA